ncbi:hypothetical protein BAUCODRAFT_126678 [Baudoinia panamericana UAMH 10762]|uniref:Glycosyl transferase CAP10 domain-containing protein n=1 Tax=Baudoinia panamericana (strain UAMH 10762) TaxID=717646 RepID=M2MK28_BAUPA|nr:uncharacterized protein BAUCODRAFT_126678 [Baudoinia panamericana UAMH 10762]EMC91683.1 hypothetical protein BAUCODRAFT_126678 [Baudoinia panamericana UAMH 10762]
MGETWRPLSSRRNVMLVCLLLVVVFLISSNQYSNLPSAEIRSDDSMQTHTVAASGINHTRTFAAPPEAPKSTWTFDVSRDRDNHSLTQEQCDVAFPRLYHEIDRAAAYWKDRLGDEQISPEMVDLKWSSDGGLTAMIYNHQLYITHARGLNHFLHWRERSHATLHQIQRAILASPERLPNIEFSVKINDLLGLNYEHPNINVTVWGFSRNISDPVMDQVWVVPDFNFWDYPRVAGSFSDYQQQAIEIKQDRFEDKKDLLVWRGTVGFKPELRWPLIMQTAGQPWSDVHRLDTEMTTPDQLQHKISMPDHCRYKYSVHTEGTSWSGRLKYLLSCHQVVIIHHLSYFTHLYHLLTPSGPGQNYVQVQNDWLDLPDKMEDLLSNPDKAKMIADSAAADFRDLYSTAAAQSCYWRRLFRTWREASYEPDPFEYRKQEDESWERHVRGMTYEEYVFHDQSVPVGA